MKNILSYKNKSLIKKYAKYYIRFTCGQYVELPCDILITQEEAGDILENQTLIDEYFKAYKAKIPWTIDTFVQSGLMDFLIYDGNYTREEAEDILAKLMKYEDLKYEMYETAMTGKYPKNSAVKVENTTAEMIAKEQGKSACKAYVELLNVRNNNNENNN